MYSEDEKFDDEMEEEENTKSSGNAAKDFYESNKKLVWIVGGLILILLLLTMTKGCGNSSNGGGNTPGNNIELVMSSESEMLSVGNSIRLDVTFAGIDDPLLVWSSSNPSVATVDQLGNVNALSLGKTTITASYKHTDGNEYKTTCEVVISEGDQNVSITSVTFPEGEVLMTQGDEFLLPRVVTPTNGYIEKVEFISGNPSVATVDTNGKIKAVSSGTAIIKMNVNNGKFTDEITVNVVMDNIDAQLIINPTVINFDKNATTVMVGQTEQLTYQALPQDAYVEDLVWSSSNESVATVDEDGVVMGVSEGAAIITVKARNNVSAVMTVQVTKNVVNVTSISLISAQNLSLKVNETSTIIPNVQPSDATDKSVIYMTNNPSVATVDANGVVTAVSQGTATITVTTNDQAKKVMVNVTVTSSSSSTGGNDSGGTSSGGNSTGGTSSGGNSTGGTTTGGSTGNSCSANNAIQLSSNSSDYSDTGSGALTNSSTSGNGSTITKSTSVTVYTDKIDSSACGGVTKVKYCVDSTYTGTNCTNFKDFNIGDNISLSFSGQGVLQLIIEAYVNNQSQPLTKKYYMAYNTSSSNTTGGNTSGGNTSGGNTGGNTNTTPPLLASFKYVDTKMMWFYGNVQFGKVTISSTAAIKKIYYCVTESNASTCTINLGKSSYSERSVGGTAPYSEYNILARGETYGKTYSTPLKTSTFKLGAWETQQFCLKAEYTNGEISPQKCVKVKSS